MKWSDELLMRFVKLVKLIQVQIPTHSLGPSHTLWLGFNINGQIVFFSHILLFVWKSIWHQQPHIQNIWRPGPSVVKSAQKIT